MCSLSSCNTVALALDRLPHVIYPMFPAFGLVRADRGCHSNPDPEYYFCDDTVFIVQVRTAVFSNLLLSVSTYSHTTADCDRSSPDFIQLVRASTPHYLGRHLPPTDTLSLRCTAAHIPNITKRRKPGC